MSYTLGIDLGTTYTAAAVARAGRVETVGLGNHAATVPSVVFLRTDGELLIGDAAQRRGLQDPDRLAREFKRRFGDATPILLGHTPYSAERLMAAILRQVVDQVSERYGGPPAAVAIAHPANWGPYKIELLHQAAQLAGLSGARFVTEPEAAAVHYASGERVDPGEVVAVYDLGGGTFDAAVLRRTEDGFVTLGEPQGIERLGGIDFDEAVLSHVRATLGPQLASLDQTDPTTRAALARLREECVAAKETLSDDSETTIGVMLPGLQSQVRLTRSEFESVIRPPVRETVATLQRAISAAGLTSADIKAVVLAGGSSRIPLVAEMVRTEIGRPVVLDAHPKHTVALGAARLAEQPQPVAAAAPASVAAAPVAAVPPPPPPEAPPPPPAAPPAAPAPPGAPPPPTQPSPLRPEPSPAGGGGGPSRGRVVGIIVAAVVVLGLGGLAAALLLGGDDGGGTEATSTTEPGAQTTTTGAGAPSCDVPQGRCVFIDSIELTGDTYVAEYTTVGYEPDIDGGSEAHHIHFFFDTVPVEEAGVPGPGEWFLWDLDPQGRKRFDGFTTADRPDGAEELCAIVATNGHAVDDGAVESCVPLPS